MNYVCCDGWRILLLLSSLSVSSVICCSEFVDVEGDRDDWDEFVGEDDRDDSGGFVGKGVLFDGVDVTVAGEVNKRKGVHCWDHWNVTWKWNIK